MKNNNDVFLHRLLKEDSATIEELIELITPCAIKHWKTYGYRIVRCNSAKSDERYPFLDYIHDSIILLIMQIETHGLIGRLHTTNEIKNYLCRIIHNKMNDEADKCERSRKDSWTIELKPIHNQEEDKVEDDHYLQQLLNDCFTIPPLNENEYIALRAYFYDFENITYKELENILGKASQNINRSVLSGIKKLKECILNKIKNGK
ncbi:hypothetical protein [Emticicia sp. W12TSBA100-4]|uniref:hypothetical protein n=1 Tax=Emticicia sp. W12TSBA100-4 TaxID=3160965 RepID=UPI003305DB72